MLAASTVRRSPTRTAVARRGLALTAVAAAALITTSACGSSTAAKTPTQTFAAAAGSLYAGNQLTTTFKIDATPAQLVAVDADRDDPLTAEEAQLITGGSVVVQAVSAGASFASDLRGGTASQAGQKISLTVNSGADPDVVQLVYAAKTLYARAAVKTLAGYAGKESAITGFEQSGVLPASDSFITAFIDGKWVKLDLASVLATLKSTTAVPSVAPSQIDALRSALVGIYAKDVTVTRDPKNSAHLVLTGNSRTIATDLLAAVKTQLSSVAGLSQLLAKADPTKVPAKVVTVDAYVTNGTLTSLKLNLVQFFSPAQVARDKGQPLAVELDFAQRASITPPAAAVAIPDDALTQLIGGLGAST